MTVAGGILHENRFDAKRGKRAQGGKSEEIGV